MRLPFRESPLDDALARAADGAFVVSTDGRVVSWNRAAERILGYTAKEALGRRCCDLLHGRDDRGNLLCYRGCHVMRLVKMRESVQNFDMRTRTKAGKDVWLNVSTIEVAASRAGGGLTVHLFRDVSASKALLEMVHERLSSREARPEAADLRAALTRREIEVLRLLASGAGTKAAAAKLHVSPATVRNHVQNLLGKLRVHSRLEAVAYAMRHGLL
jgi:PAS domain S-box-containing protein